MSSSVSRLDRVTVDPAVVHGKPAIRGTRMPVQTVLELLAAGMSFEEILEDYPYLEREDLLAALEYGRLSPVADTSACRRSCVSLLTLSCRLGSRAS